MNEHHGSSILVSLALAATLVAPGCHHGKTVERKSTAETTVQPAADDAVVPGRIVAPGIVETWDGDVRLSAQESGWIAEVLVKEGQAVTAGQLLARLDDEPQKHAVELAKAGLAEAEAQLAKLFRGATKEEIEQSRAEYEAATTQALLAESEGQRASRLHEKGSIAQAELDRAMTAAKAQAAVAKAAEARRLAVQKGARSEDRSIARGRADAARVRVQQAETDLARRQIVAPIAGTILVSRFHAGEFFAVGAVPLMVLGDTSRYQVRLEVDEIDSPRVAIGANCSIHTDDGVKLADGKVFRAAPKMGRRGLNTETPTERNDIRVREVFVEVPGSAPLVPGQRVWGRTAGTSAPAGAAAAPDAGAP